MDLRVSRAVLWLSTTLKTSKPTFHQAPLEIKAFPDDRRICPFTYLKEYLRRTVKLRQTKQLFIQLRQPHTAISRDTLRRWTRETLSAAGIDMVRFKPHSTRSASTSWAAHKEVSVDKIMAAAGWRSSNTFAQFYKRPITDRSKDFDWALLHSINTPLNRYNSSIHTTITTLKISLVPPLAIGWDRVNKLNELTVKFNWNSIDSMSQRRNKRPPSAVSISLPPYLVCSSLCGWL